MDISQKLEIELSNIFLIIPTCACKIRVQYDIVVIETTRDVATRANSADAFHEILFRGSPS